MITIRGFSPKIRGDLPPSSPTLVTRLDLQDQYYSVLVVKQLLKLALSVSKNTLRITSLLSDCMCWLTRNWCDIRNTEY